MKLSQLVQSNQTFNSNTYKNLSPVMKEAVNDVFKLVEKSQDDILKRFDKSVEKVCEFHNINKEQIEQYFDDELVEQLGEK
jgi:cell division protein FtsI/penicillin-binding protein 2